MVGVVVGDEWSPAAILQPPGGPQPAPRPRIDDRRPVAPGQQPDVIVLERRNERYFRHAGTIGRRARCQFQVWNVARQPPGTLRHRLGTQPPRSRRKRRVRFQRAATGAAGMRLPLVQSIPLRQKASDPAPSTSSATSPPCLSRPTAPDLVVLPTCSNSTPTRTRSCGRSRHPDSRRPGHHPRLQPALPVGSAPPLRAGSRFPWQRAATLGLQRLKDWLKLLGFEVDRGVFGCYVPPLRQEKWLQRWRFIERAGGRWWSLGAASTCCVAIKRVHGMRLIPNWRKRPTRPRPCGRWRKGTAP